MRYLVKVQYACPNLKHNGEWVEIESLTPPKVRVLENKLLPDHNCQRYIDSQACEEDDTCYWQQIIEVRPFSEDEARRLGAESELVEACTNL